MFTYQTSSFISYLRSDLLRGTCEVQLKDGKFYRFTNVSRRAILHLELSRMISLGFWFNHNLLDSTRTNGTLVFDLNN